MWWFFYVLKSESHENWFYKGYTNNIDKRLSEHNAGLTQSNNHYRPLKLIYFEAYQTKKAAMNREYSVKKSGSVWTPLMKRIKGEFR